MPGVRARAPRNAATAPGRVPTKPTERGYCVLRVSLVPSVPGRETSTPPGHEPIHRGFLKRKRPGPSLTPRAKPDAHAAEFVDIQKQRAALEVECARLAPAEAGARGPEDAADAVCYALKRLAAVPAAGEISAAEKRALLSRIVDEIVPDSRSTEARLKACGIYLYRTLTGGTRRPGGTAGAAWSS